MWVKSWAQKEIGIITLNPPSFNKFLQSLMVYNNNNLQLLTIWSVGWVVPLLFLLGSLAQSCIQPGLENLRRSNSHFWQSVLAVLWGTYVCLPIDQTCFLITWQPQSRAPRG